jgi:hypothetical protein
VEILRSIDRARRYLSRSSCVSMAAINFALPEGTYG